MPSVPLEATPQDRPALPLNDRETETQLEGGWSPNCCGCLLPPIIPRQHLCASLRLCSEFSWWQMVEGTVHVSDSEGLLSSCGELCSLLGLRVGEGCSGVDLESR